MLLLGLLEGVHGLSSRSPIGLCVPTPCFLRWGMQTLLGYFEILEGGGYFLSAIFDHVVPSDAGGGELL